MPPPHSPIGFRLLHELDGLLRGITADTVIVPDEISRLERWLDGSDSFRTIHPFSEIAPRIDRALSDGVLTLEECHDLLFVTNKMTTVNPYYDGMRSGLQTLMGVMAGVAADREINEAELRMLGAWLDDWSNLRGLWPYDECESVIRCILESRDPGELPYLFALAEQFPVAGHCAYDASAALLISGLCAINPQLKFAEKRFVITGESTRAERREIEQHVHNRDGLTSKNVSKKTDYLIVCDCGSPFWAFSCYGRKVEEAYLLRREGHPIVIAHEHDLWAALESQ